MIYWYIINKTKILNSSKNIRLLHITPEKNLQKILRTFSHIEYISGDLNPLMDCDIKLDIADMNFEDNFFDVIICNHVLEHIKDYQKAMSELFRVLISVSVGFKVGLYNIKKELNIKEIKKFALNEEEILYICQKL